MGAQGGVKRKASRACVVHVDDDGNAGRQHKRGRIAPHPFEADYNDHFETSDEAVHDIAYIIEALARSLGKEPSKLRIYDPYYCNGSIVGTWTRAGFPRCYNENEDCYKVWEEGTEPEYDCIITNPPYSGQHKEWCIRHCVESGKPWLLLLPNYCATKQYFTSLIGGAPAFFIIPNNAYIFTHPEGTGYDDSPFHSIWMGSMNRHHANVLSAARRNYAAPLKVEESIEKLKEDKIVPGKRMNPKQRAKLRKKLAAE